MRLVTVPVQLLHYGLSPLYAISFGILDKRLARKQERQLSVDVGFAFSTVFGEGHCHAIPNYDVPFPPGFDYAYTTLEFDHFFLRFLRGRGEFYARIAPSFARSDFHDLSLVLCIARGESELARTKFRDAWHAARSLHPYLPTVNGLLTSETFPELKGRLGREVYSAERFANRKWETEINMRLYGKS